MSILRKHPKKIIAGALAGVLVTGGTAVAAFLLSTAFTGSTAFADKNVDDEIVAVAGGVNALLDCDDIQIAAQGEAIVFKPIGTRYVGGTESEVPAQSCEIQATLKNVGDVPLYLHGFTGFEGGGADGWVIDVTQATTDAVAPGASTVIKATLSVDGEGTEPATGAFSAAIKTGDAPAGA